MVVLAIIGVLSAISIPLYNGYRQRSVQAQAEADIRMLSTLIAQYQADHLSFPNSLDDLGSTRLVDPWGHRYRYLNLTGSYPAGKARKHASIGRINTDYDLYSVGVDGDSHPPLTAKESRDDIVRANNGRYIGPASEY